jgi:SOS-response transcriptional repressor LexA
MSEMHERLREARQAAGYETAAAAAAALGINYQTYAGHENSKTGIRHQAAQRYAKKFRVSLEWLLTGKGDMRGDGGRTPADEAGLAVLGTIRAGHWLDTTVADVDEIPEHVPLIPDARYHGRQYTLRVEGTSMNQVFPDGSFAQCVDFAESGLSLRAGMIAHVERRNGDLVEITLKRVERNGKKWRLMPASTDPKWQPIDFDADDDSGEVVIRGLAIASYRQL